MGWTLFRRPNHGAPWERVLGAVVFRTRPAAVTAFRAWLNEQLLPDQTPRFQVEEVDTGRAWTRPIPKPVARKHAVPEEWPPEKPPNASNGSRIRAMKRKGDKDAPQDWVSPSPSIASRDEVMKSLVEAQRQHLERRIR